jgi:hypothetical protein
VSAAEQLPDRVGAAAIIEPSRRASGERLVGNVQPAQIRACQLGARPECAD